MTKILSLDPGGTTGYAIVEATDTGVSLLEAGQIPEDLKGFIKWYDTRGRRDWDVVVCESFILRPSVKFPDLSPVYIIGALEALEAPWEKEITYQAPSSKPLCNDDTLKRLEFYQVGKGHANDAIRHAIIYLRTKRHMPTLRKAWPYED